MQIDRNQFLLDLELVRSGLSPREFIEQSSCFVFQNGHVMTFNDEIACKKKVSIEMTGAILADVLLTILAKLDDDELAVRVTDNELQFRGKGKSFGVKMESEIYLPLDQVENPTKWRELPKEFLEAMKLVKDCVSSEESRFQLTCIHIHPEYMEACDNYQAMRYRLDIPIKSPILLRGKSMETMLQLGMVEIALTESWIHFRNEKGLQFSCRRFAEEYIDLTRILDVDGHVIKFPKGVGDATDRAEIFAGDKMSQPMVRVEIDADVIRIRGEGVAGWYSEGRACKYEGPKMVFMIRPELLKYVSSKNEKAMITDSKLKIIGPGWEYVSVLAQPVEAVEEPKKEKKKKERK